MRCGEITYNKIVTKLLKCGSVSGGDSIKLMHQSKVNFKQNSPINILSAKNNSCNELSYGRIFGYVQCDIEVPEHLRDYFSNFPPIFKNIVVSTDDIGNLMKEYAEKEGIMPQPRGVLISSSILTNGTTIAPMLLFYLKLGLV